jgi:hypothetical protein
VLSPSPTLRVPTTRRRFRANGGFTLVETLVAMLTGIIVTGALFAILEVSLHQSARAGDVVQASQLGRATMSRVVNELRSACLSPEFTPVQANSTTGELRFINAYSEQAVIANSSAAEHRLVFNESARTLTDYKYAATGGSWPAFTFSSTASPSSGTLIGENVVLQENAKKELVPMFQYFKYATEAGTAETGAPVETLTPMSLASGEKLTATTSDEVAAVQVSFTARPTNNAKTLGRVANFSSQVTFAFSAPNPEATIVDGPCQ